MLSLSHQSPQAVLRPYVELIAMYYIFRLISFQRSKDSEKNHNHCSFFCLTGDICKNFPALRQNICFQTTTVAF